MNRLTDWYTQLGWAAVLCLTLAFMIGVCIVVLIIDAWIHREPKRRIRAFDARVGRDVYRDLKGLTKS